MIPIVASAVLIVAAATPGSPPPSASDVLSNMAKQSAGLEAYDVPVTIHAVIKKVISIPFSLSGERYFVAPDKEALKLKTVPSIARAFSNLYASLGTPLTWAQTYNLQVVPSDHVTTQPTYELLGTYKRSSSVDHILLDIDAVTYDPLEVRWFYRNGATIVMNVQEQSVGTFRLPSVENVEVHFPGYSGHATISYGTYDVNAAVPDSVFNN